MAGTVIERVDRRGKVVRDNNFLTLFNAHHERIDFLLPEFHSGGAWEVVLDTANAKHPFQQKHYEAGAAFPLEGRSLALFIATSPHPALHYKGGERGAAATQPPVKDRAPTKPATASLALTQPDAKESPASSTVVQLPAKEPSSGGASPPPSANDAPPGGAVSATRTPAPMTPQPAPATTEHAMPSATPTATEPLPDKLGEDSKGG
jgi:hypothetical protein